MFYTLDKNSLEYKDATTIIIKIIVLIGVIFMIINMVYGYYNANNIKYITEETKAIIINEANKENQFSEPKLKEYILELNIKFPHIVLAQSQLETGHYTSKIFRENHNLFGLKQAKQRPCTALGTENDHSYYNNWRESVQDYAMYSARYLSQLRTEEEYFQYLGQNYAEDPNYITKLKTIIKNNNDMLKK
jgi:uncharacterized FlgJ-related protein